MANEFIARNGLIVLDNGIQITGSGRFSTDITSSGNIKATAFYGDGANVTGVVSSSFATTASYVKVSSIEGTVSSASYALTSSLATGNVTTASVVGGTITFTKGDGTTFPITITTSTVDTASYIDYGNVANKPTLVSASSQIDVTQTTGIATIATTGSNTFTGAQTITDTTNATDWNTGALIVDGGVGIEKDVWISGSLNVLGLLTAVSTSIQYITSSQVDIGTNIIRLNTNTPALRYAGLAVIDSGSVGVSASLLYDSITNNWVFKHKDVGESTEDFSNVLFGPLGTDADNIPTLTGNYITKVENDGHGHHLTTSSIADNGTLVTVGTSLSVVGSISASVFSGSGAQLSNVTATSVDFANIANKPALVSASSQVSYTGLSNIPSGIVSSSTQFDSLTSPFTGSFTGSFTGNGSGLTGLATTLRVSGSTSGTGTIDLLTQGLIVSGTTGISSTVSGQTITLAGINATTTTKGVASFNTSNFTVTEGAVSTKAAVVNGVNVELGSSVNISLAEITSASAVTPDQVTLNGGAIIHGVLHTSGSSTGLTDGANQVIVGISTGSYDAAHFDYVIKSGENLRTGTVMVIWQSGTTNIEFTDTSTNDIGSTLNQSFTADTSSGNVRLKFTTTGGNTWAVKTAVRMI